MAGQRSLASEYDDDGSRCQKTDGRRWRCPMPAQPNKSFCSHHRLPIIKTPPSSLHQNPSRALDHRKTGPGESEEDSEHDNLGSDKKRRRRKEMAVSDLVAEKSPTLVDASTKKRGSKKKKIEPSGARQVSDSLNSDKGEVDIVIEKGNLSSDPIETIKKKRDRTKKKLVDSNYLLNSEAKRESRAESEIEKLENSSDKAADVVIGLGLEKVAKVLYLENAYDSVNQKDKSSDVKFGVEMDQQTDIDNLDMLDSEVNKEKTTTRCDMDNFEVSSGKESIIETDSGLVKVKENIDLLEANKRKRRLKLKAADSDINKVHGLDSNMMSEFGGDLVARVREMNHSERANVEMKSGNKSYHILDYLNKNDKSQKKETVSSYQTPEGRLSVSDVQNHENNADKTAGKTEVEMDLSGKDDQNVGMLETNQSKERKKVGVLEVQELEKSSNIVAGIEENIIQTSGHESYDVNNKNIIDDGDPEGPKLSESSDKTAAVEIVVEQDVGLEQPGEILGMFGTDRCSNQPVENSNSDKCNQISRRKRGKEILNCSEVDLDGELLNQTLSSFKTNKKRNKKEGKAEISEESEAEFDPIAHDLMRIAVKRQMEKIEKKLRQEKESEVRKELPNGVMAISPSPITFSSNTVHALDNKIGLVVGDNFLMQRRFRSKNVEPEPIAVVKKLPIRVSRGEKKGKTVQKSGKMDIQRGTATSIPEELSGDQHRSSSIQSTDYMISQLRPVLKLLGWEQVLELEIEAKNQGKNLAGVRVQTIDCAQDMQYKCNFCRGSIVNLLRGCSNCCYKLCLSCCQEIRGKNLPKEAEIMTSGYAIEQKHNDRFAETHDRKKKGSFSSKTRDEQIPCPPTGLGGCGQEVLIMKLLLPYGLLESMEGGSNSG